MNEIKYLKYFFILFYFISLFSFNLIIKLIMTKFNTTY